MFRFLSKKRFAPGDICITIAGGHGPEWALVPGGLEVELIRYVGDVECSEDPFYILEGAWHVKGGGFPPNTAISEGLLRPLPPPNGVVEWADCVWQPDAASLEQ